MHSEVHLEVHLKVFGFFVAFLFVQSLFAASPLDLDQYFKHFHYQPEVLAKKSQCAQELVPEVDTTPLQVSLSELFAYYDNKGLRSFVEESLVRVFSISESDYFSQPIEEQLRVLRDVSLLFWLHKNNSKIFSKKFNLEILKERFVSLLKGIEERINAHAPYAHIVHLRDWIQILSILELNLPSFFSSNDHVSTDIQSTQAFLSVNHTLNLILQPLIEPIESNIWSSSLFQSLQPFFPDIPFSLPENALFQIAEPLHINVQRIVGGAMLFGSGKALLLLAKFGDSSQALGQALSSSMKGYLLLDSAMQTQSANVMIQQLLIFTHGRLRLKSKGADTDPGRFPAASLRALEGLEREFDRHLVTFLKNYDFKLVREGSQVEEMERLLAACLTNPNLDLHLLPKLKELLLRIQMLIFQVPFHGSPSGGGAH